MHHHQIAGLPARILLLLGGLALLAGLTAVPAAANGNPVSIVLSYLNGVSTWGPTNATGVVELVPREGQVKLTATGLQRLTNERYELWLLKAGTTERMPLGAFNAGDDGVAKLELVLDDAIPDKGWDMVMVTVEPAGAPPGEPGARRSIAGRFPVAPAAGTGGPAGTSASPVAGATVEPQPPQLPRTGGEGAAPVVPLPAPAAPGTDRASLALLGVGALALVGLVGIMLRRARGGGGSRGGRA